MNYGTISKSQFRKNKEKEKFKKFAGWSLFCALFIGMMLLGVFKAPNEEVRAEKPEITAVFNVEQEIAYKTVQARVTGYNTVPEQTDATPCLAASGHNICGRSDVVACPRYIQLGTKVEIDGKIYTCLDRTAKKYGNRFDISCDKDKKCPARVTGNKEVKIFAK